jgi:lysophospholipase L1-like esterase
MKRVILVGDSIRMGYQEIVRAELEGWADVWGPEQNGGTSENVLAHLDEWVITRRPDVLHINCGLHDLRKEFGQDGAAIPLGAYADNLRTIMTRVKTETDAIVVWALTTPVNQEWHHRIKGFDRFEADVAAYNAAATEIAQELNIVVNDLVATVTSAGRDDLLLPDGVHFKPQGYTLLGKAVADQIKRVADVI